MGADSVDPDLVSERSLLERATQLQWFHWCAVALSVVLTFAASGISRHLLDEKLAVRFDNQTRHVMELIAERMAKYEDALWAGRSLLESHDLEIEEPAWAEYAASIRIDLKYPGINGIGVIHRVRAAELDSFRARQRRLRPDFRVHPRREAGEYLPITFIEPVAENREAVGLDVAFESNRRIAAARARDLGTAQITGPITLVQDEGRTPGFLFYVPFYRGETETIEARREAFAGLVYAPFVVRKLMEGTLQKANRDVAIRISDGEHVIYDELHVGEPDFDPRPTYRRRIEHEFYGRPWTVQVWSGPVFREGAASSQPLTILVAGLFVDLMLLVMFLRLSAVNRRALGYANAMTSALESKADRLQSANQDLEKISFLASHDLKTPVRGIANVVGFIQEDCKEVIDGPMAEYIDRILTLTHRMNELLDDLFEYSCLVNRRDLKTEWVEIEELISEIEELNDLGGVRLEFKSDVSGLRVPPVLLKSILNNLIMNAVKHGAAASGRPTVEVRCRNAGADELEFSVRDYGEGVPADKREMVFEMFKQLRNRDLVGGTGVGLAVVKHVVMRAGGRVWVEQPPDGGARFVFTWPRDYRQDL